jgi:2-oxoglutarate ferredoxin oxidoreductase subunit beta
MTASIAAAAPEPAAPEAPAPRPPADYKSDIKPVWCPGCGDYSVLTSLAMALSALALPPERVAVVSGIGCSSRMPAYLNTYGFHGVHGRALPVATGIKLSRPELTVVVAGGDGDGFSIGGNHFLHACRRNVDLAYLVMDNRVYGMTKGQPSPTTEPEWDSDLAPGGTGLRPFNPLAIALAAGANMVARCFSGDPARTAAVIAEAIRHPGFSFVEILSPCVTFRPDEREWRDKVRPAPVTETNDPARAARRLMTDDGFNLGILYRGDRRPYQPRPDASPDALAALEHSFAI